MGQDISVGIAACYALDGRIPVGARFSGPVQTGFGAHPTPYTSTLGVPSLPGAKRLGRDFDHPFPSKRWG